MPFTAWESFYVIVGSAAAALTGLMFVVLALVADSANSSRQIDAFGTPTVVHFGTVLLISAIMSAPWPQLSGARIALGLCGARRSRVYGLIVLRRARSQTDYKPVFEDWLFYTAAARRLHEHPRSCDETVTASGAPVRNRRGDGPAVVRRHSQLVGYDHLHRRLAKGKAFT